MEILFYILGFVMLAFGILQIILFFKLWGMTNDVRRIKQRFVVNIDDQEKEIIKAIYKRESNLEQRLFDFAYSVFERTYLYCIEWGFTGMKQTELFERKLKKVIPVYNKAGIAVPEIFGAIKSCKDFDAYFSLPKE